MREAFRRINFREEKLIRIQQCNEIIEEYLDQGLRLTLRQLYYQLVSRNVIPNVERSYKNLSSLVSDARLAGMMDWDAIEDRGRQPKAASEFSGLQELTDAALESYRLPRWADQEYYIELWVEKDALAGVLWPIAREYHVTLMVNKGYSSQSAMFEAANRFRAFGTTKESVLLYLGDLDPSGEDMVRDIDDRLRMFGAEVEVIKVALTKKLVETYDPPPNPAKLTDPRAHKYIQEHGMQSWEVDALPPNVLTRLLRAAFDAVIDRAAMDRVIAQEEKDKKRLKKAVATLAK